MNAEYIEGTHFGEPSVLSIKREVLAPPGRGEILLNQHAIGVNFIDILQRRGELAQHQPYRLGLEGAGTVVTLGEGVDHLLPGDRIVYAGGAPGAYASARVLPADRAVRLPDWLDFSEAAACFFKALTADYLVHRLRPIDPNDWVLFTAAAGGVGSIAIPLLKAKGARVIGTVGSRAKVEAAQGLGCDHVIVLGQDNDDAAGRVREWTAGSGVAVAFDSLGKASFDLSLGALAPFGLLVSYGWASGDIGSISPMDLRTQGSVFFTRPTIAHYTQARTDLDQAAARVFAAFEDGTIKPTIFARLPLDRAGEAHAILEQGENIGSVVLEPTKHLGAS